MKNNTYTDIVVYSLLVLITIAGFLFRARYVIDGGIQMSDSIFYNYFSFYSDKSTYQTMFLGWSKPLFTHMLGIGTRLFDSSPRMTILLVSAIPGALNTVFAFFIANKILDKYAGLIAALFAALFPVILFSSTTHGAHDLNATFMLLSFWAFLYYVETRELFFVAVASLMIFISFGIHPVVLTGILCYFALVWAYSFKEKKYKDIWVCALFFAVPLLAFEAAAHLASGVSYIYGIYTHAEMANMHGELDIPFWLSGPLTFINLKTGLWYQGLILFLFYFPAGYLLYRSVTQKKFIYFALVFLAYATFAYWAIQTTKTPLIRTLQPFWLLISIAIGISVGEVFKLLRQRQWAGRISRGIPYAMFGALFLVLFVMNTRLGWALSSVRSDLINVKNVVEKQIMHDTTIVYYINPKCARSHSGIARYKYLFKNLYQKRGVKFAWINAPSKFVEILANQNSNVVLTQVPLEESVINENGLKLVKLSIWWSEPKEYSDIDIGENGIWNPTPCRSLWVYGKSN